MEAGLRCQEVGLSGELKRNRRNQHLRGGGENQQMARGPDSFFRKNAGEKTEGNKATHET